MLPETEIPEHAANLAFRRYLTPFAPDQSGAVGVLFELGGIQVICDAGGCVGNICGFDEPRWFRQKSAIFSAGLRDMDAILGRDDQLVGKLTTAVNEIQPAFASVIGTPVPAVIATDYHALRRMAEKKTKLPVLTVETNGMDLYDEGEKKAYLELFSVFAEEVQQVSEVQKPSAVPQQSEVSEGAGEKGNQMVEEDRIGVLGVTPLNYSDLSAGKKIQAVLKKQGWNTVDTYGMDCGLERVKTAGKARKNLVAAPSGVAAARYLEKRFGTPYEIWDPLAEEILEGLLRQLPQGENCQGKNILIVSQQVSAVTMRKLLLEKGAGQVCVATWFMKLPEISREGDLRLTGEKQFTEAVYQGDYDWIMADPELKNLVQQYTGSWLDLPHFAVSGKMH
ncbi:MAG: nitrogenase component 1 [Lachnospiraceae bacterium]|nr:nitrogenase component 1 [Lachnospiraceae bacterium]